MTQQDKVNILLVDDQPGKLLTYETMLAELGENLIRAESAREALDLLLKIDVAVILVDVCMPELDGFELSALIRQHPRFQKTAIILVSAVFMSDLDRLKGYTSGAMDYVPVPVVPEILRAKVSVFVELYRNNRRLESLTEQLEQRVAERTRELEIANAMEHERASELEALLDAVPAIVWRAHDPECRRITGNKMSAAFLRIGTSDNASKTAPQEEKPQHFQVRINGQEVQDSDLPMQVAASKGISVRDIEAEHRFKDGSRSYLYGNAAPLFDAEGRPRGSVGAFIDITAPKRAQQALRESEERTRLIIDTALDAVISMDDHGRINGWNRQAEITFGWTAAEALNQPMEKLIMPERYRQAHLQGVARFLATGEGSILNQRIEMSAIRRDGSEFPVELTVTATRSGESYLFSGFVRDISERRKAEEERRLSAQRLAVEHTVTRVIAESISFQEAIPQILKALGESLGFAFCAFWEVSADNSHLRCLDLWPMGSTDMTAFAQTTQETAFKPGIGLPGRVWTTGDPAWIRDLSQDTNFPRQKAARISNLASGAAFPIRVGGEFIGVIEFFRGEVSEPDADLLTMMSAVGSEIGQFIQRKKAESARAELRVREQQAAREIQVRDEQYRFLEEAIPEVMRRRGWSGVLNIEEKQKRKSVRPPWRRRFTGSAKQYLVAVLFVALAVAIKLATGSIVSEKYPFFLTTAAVLGAAWYGGLMPGLSATLLTVLTVDWLYMEPVHSFRVASPVDVVHLAIFTLEGVFISFATSYLKQARDDRSRLLVREQAAKSAAQTGEQRYRSLVNASAAIVWTTAADGRFMAPQSSWESFTGQPWEKQSEMGWFEAIHPEERSTMREAWSRSLKEGKLYESETRIWNAQTFKYHYCTVRAAPVINPDGTIREWVGSCQDVTERRLAEEALVESERRFRTMADSAPVLIWTSDTTGQFDYFNRRWIEFTGRSMEQEIGQGRTEGMHPEDRERCRDVYVSSFEARREFTLEYRLRRADGEYRWIIENAVPRFTPKGDFSGYIGSCKDITDRRRAEDVLLQHRARLEEMVAERTAALRQSQEQLLRTERLASIGILAAGIAHEINNPLNSILLTAEYALRGKQLEPDQIRESLQTIRQEAERGGEVVKGVLKFAREEKTLKSPGDLNAVVLEAAKLIGTYVRAAHLSVELELATSLPSVIINATEIEQVLINLVKNAADATEDVVRVVIRTRAQGEWVEVDVEDNGPGIPEPILARIFDPFFSTRHGSGGTGLGLSICHGIVTDHGGSIRVRSQVGPGTTFMIRLPIPQS